MSMDIAKILVLKQKKGKETKSIQSTQQALNQNN